MAGTDHYSRLGLDGNAANTISERDIRKAYTKLSKKAHPDKGGSKEEFQRLKDSYDVLSDKAKRKQHDAELQRRKSKSKSQGVSFNKAAGSAGGFFNKKYASPPQEGPRKSSDRNVGSPGRTPRGTPGMKKQSRWNFESSKGASSSRGPNFNPSEPAGNTSAKQQQQKNTSRRKEDEEDFSSSDNNSDLYDDDFLASDDDFKKDCKGDDGFFASAKSKFARQFWKDVKRSEKDRKERAKRSEGNYFTGASGSGSTGPSKDKGSDHHDATGSTWRRTGSQTRSRHGAEFRGFNNQKSGYYSATGDGYFEEENSSENSENYVDSDFEGPLLGRKRRRKDPGNMGAGKFRSGNLSDDSDLGQYPNSGTRNNAQNSKWATAFKESAIRNEQNRQEMIAGRQKWLQERAQKEREMQQKTKPERKTKPEKPEVIAREVITLSSDSSEDEKKAEKAASKKKNSKDRIQSDSSESSGSSDSNSSDSDSSDSDSDSSDSSDSDSKDSISEDDSAINVESELSSEEASPQDKMKKHSSEKSKKHSRGTPTVPKKELERELERDSKSGSKKDSLKRAKKHTKGKEKSKKLFEKG